MAVVVEAYDPAIRLFVEFVRPRRDEPHGRVAVFVDVAGNRWDLLGPPSAPGP